MAQSQLSITNEQKDLECTICLSDFTEPKLLACLHTFCMTCLKRYCEEIDEEEKPCPLCRTEFLVPEGGVETLKTDQVKTRLVLEKQAREGKQNLLKCDVCKDVEAKAYCAECMQSLCSECIQAHSKFNCARLHKIVSMNEKPNEEALQKIKSQFCTAHVGKQIELYCCDCEKLLCYSCHATGHNRHVCKIPSEVAKSKREEFKNDENRITRCINDEIKKVIEMKTGSMTHLGEINKVEQVAKESLAVMVNHLEEQISKLLTSLREMREEKLKTVKSEDCVSEFRCAELNSFLEYSKMMMERGTDYEILTIANELHNRAENLTKKQEDRNREEPALTNLEFLTTITSKIHEVKNTVLEIDLPRQNPSTKLDLQLQKLHLKADLQQQNPSLKLEIQQTPVSRQISVPGLTDARGLVYNESDSCLYASNWSTGHIYKINPRINNKVTGWATQTDSPWGLSISKQKNLLVSYTSSGQIHEFNGSGQLIRSIKLNDGKSGIFHSIELETGEFIVCQCEPRHRICLVNFLGKVLKSYGKERGSLVGQIIYPFHVELLDQKGNILVTDHNNHKLRVLTSDLKYVADVNITDKQFREPTSTCWDKENDRLLVTTASKHFYAITPQA